MVGIACITHGRAHCFSNAALTFKSPTVLVELSMLHMSWLDGR